MIHVVAKVIMDVLNERVVDCFVWYSCPKDTVHVLNQFARCGLFTYVKFSVKILVS